MDGTEDTQPPVGPGETFTYRFAFPDAGTFWYHPHANETVQLERGFHGVLIVRGENEPKVDAERILVFDDVQLDRWGGVVLLAEPGRIHSGHSGRVWPHGHHPVKGRDPTVVEGTCPTDSDEVVYPVQAGHWTSPAGMSPGRPDCACTGSVVFDGL